MSFSGKTSLTVPFPGQNNRDGAEAVQAFKKGTWAYKQKYQREP
jgi:hypothetical protein